MLLLADTDVRRLLDVHECIDAVDAAFQSHARGQALTPGLTHTDTSGGEFHVKTGGTQTVFGAKVNGAFKPPAGSKRPAIRGVITLFDAAEGGPLAILDSAAITGARTGAATAVAARALAKKDSRSVALLGAGTQARNQLRYLQAVFPIDAVTCWTRDAARASDFVTWAQADLRTPVKAAKTPGAAVRDADIIVTCTPSHQPFLLAGDVEPGQFVAAVGADSPEKQELDPRLLAASRVVPDILGQAAEVGELHHALKAGLMKREDVHGELGQVLIGNVPGRTDPRTTFIFDSTGTALQDVAVGALILEKAKKQGVGTEFAFR